jgi:tetratricopeptide (TPR) repeat protein
LGILLSYLGRREEALVVSEEALAIYRELAAQNRDAFLPDLAETLSRYGDRLVEADKMAEAVLVYREAADIFNELKQAEPDAYQDWSVWNLRDLVKAMRSVGADEAAIAALAQTYGFSLFELEQAAEAENAEAESVTDGSTVEPPPAADGQESLANAAPVSFVKTRSKGGGAVLVLLIVALVLVAGLAALVVWGPMLGLNFGRDVWRAVLDIFRQ